MMSDASEMLAAALEQMDGIIAGKLRAAAAALSGRGPWQSRATSGSSLPWWWECCPLYPPSPHPPPPSSSGARACCRTSVCRCSPLGE